MHRRERRALEALARLELQLETALLQVLRGCSVRAQVFAKKQQRLLRQIVGLKARLGSLQPVTVTAV